MHHKPSYTSALHTFEQESRPIFVLYGARSRIEGVMSDFQAHLRERGDLLYLPLNMEQGKHETPEETYFDVIQQLLNTLLDVVTDGDNQAQLSSLFRKIWNLRKNTKQADADHQLAEFIRFTRHSCYPVLSETLNTVRQPVVIGLERFEQVAMWSGRLYNVILENLLEALPVGAQASCPQTQGGQDVRAPKIAGLTGVPLRFVVFVQEAKKPAFFYGSNEEGSKERVAFYDVSRSQASGISEE